MRQPGSLAKSDPASSAVKILLLAFGIVVLLTLLWVGRVIFMLLFAAIVVALLLSEVVDWLKAKLHLKRSLAFAATLLAVCSIVILSVWIVGPRIVDQFADLQRDLPQAAGQMISRIAGYPWGRWALAQWSDYSQAADNITSAVTRIGGFVLSTATLLAGLVLVAVLGIYLAAEPELYLSGMRRAIPLRYRTTALACLTNAAQTVRWWLLSQILSMTAVGLIVTLGLWILGVPLAVTLGIVAALLTFIPNVGPILSVVPAALLAFTISPAKGVLAILLFLLVHFLEGNIITPLLERKIVSLPPALTMIAQLLLAVIAGPLGLALAAPMTAAILGVLHILLPPEEPASPLQQTLP